MATLFAGDLLTGLIRVRDIPVSSGTATIKRGAPGSIWATVALPAIDPATGVEVQLDNLIAPGRSFLGYAEGDRIINAGPILSDDLNMASGKWELRASGLRSYFDYRYVLAALSNIDMSDLPTTHTSSWTNLSLRTIAKRIVQQTLTWTGGALPIVFEADVAGTDSRTYPGWELHRVSEKLAQLSEVTNGPEIAFRPRFKEDRRYIEWEMVTGNPELKQAGPDHSWDTTVPAPAVKALTITRDGGQMATDVYEVGDKAAAALATDPPTMARQYDATLVTSGYPRFEQAETRSSVTGASTLQEYANKAVLSRRGPAETWKLAVKGDLAPTVGSLYEGDYAQLVTKGAPRLGTGKNRVRIDSITVRKGDEYADIEALPERTVGGYPIPSNNQTWLKDELLRLTREIADANRRALK